MIKTFADKTTAAVFANQRVRKLPPDVLQVARRKLALLDQAARINDQWRLCFRFQEGHAYDVEIVDYHCGH